MDDIRKGLLHKFSTLFLERLAKALFEFNKCTGTKARDLKSHAKLRHLEETLANMELMTFTGQAVGLFHNTQGRTYHDELTYQNVDTLFNDGLADWLRHYTASLEAAAAEEEDDEGVEFDSDSDDDLDEEDFADLLSGTLVEPPAWTKGWEQLKTMGKIMDQQVDYLTMNNYQFLQNS